MDPTFQDDLRKALPGLNPPSPPLLKVCGLREAAQATAVAGLGVDAVGVIGVANSPRWVEPGHRPGLFAAVEAGRAGCGRVLVVADPPDRELIDLDPGRGGHNVLQLHGDESPSRCQELRRRLPPGLTIWKALRIRSRDDLAKVGPYAAVVDGLLLDAWVPGALGGTGQSLPLDWLMGFNPGLPWWLAGGITPERVGLILAQLHPSGLDASSGVERSPGVKDLDRVEALVAAVAAYRRTAPGDGPPG
jgi:phosphoribosylanthranilate isomerase